MAQVQSWVQLVRNGACNIRTLVEVFGGSNGTALVNALNNNVIAPTQFLAAAFNLLNGASDIVGGVEQAGRFSAWAAGLKQARGSGGPGEQIMSRSVQKSWANACWRVLGGIIQLSFSAAFFVLACNTISDSLTLEKYLGPHFSKANIGLLTWDALALMDVGLVYFLWAMWTKYRGDVCNERRFNKLAELLDTTSFGSNDDATAIVDLARQAGFAEADLPDAYHAMMPASHKPLWLNAANAGAASVERALNSTEDALSGLVDGKSSSDKISAAKQARSNAAYKLRVLAYEAGNDAPAALIFFLLNVIAGYGYMLGILASPKYFPDSVMDARGRTRSQLVKPWHYALKFGLSHSTSAWWGNVVGDTAWTVEPLLAIVAAHFSAPISTDAGTAPSSSKGASFQVTSTTPNHRGRGRAPTPGASSKTGASPSPSPRGRSQSPKASKAAPKRSSSKAKKA